MYDQTVFDVESGEDQGLYSFNLESSVNRPIPSSSTLHDDAQNNLLSGINLSPHENSQSTRPTEPNNGTTTSNSKARKDQKARNLAQNICSTLLTKIPKRLYSKKKELKATVKQCKDRLKKFLTDNGANNNQLIILFGYLFMLKERASSIQIQDLQTDVIEYLVKRINDSKSMTDDDDKKTLLEKIEIHKKLAERYLDGSNQAFEEEELRLICGRLFTEKQKGTIKKPIEMLLKIQKELQQQQSQFFINFEQNHNTKDSFF